LLDQSHSEFLFISGADIASTAQDVHESDFDLDYLTTTQSVSTSTTARKKRIRHQFSLQTFQLTFSADASALNDVRASSSVTLQERLKYLSEHIRSGMENTDRMQHMVTFVQVYYHTSVISTALPEGILISIPLLGFVQTRAHTL
jgi:hypothetical protein